MKFSETVGIDISKSWIDAKMHLAGYQKRFDNSPGGFKDLLSWVSGLLSKPRESVLFAFEHTGLYSYGLARHLTTHGLSFIIIPALELNRSMGIVRGKDDHIDAAKIALYAYRRKDEITPSRLPEMVFVNLRHLLTLRDRLVKQRAGFLTSLKESECFLSKSKEQIYFQIQKQMIQYLNKQISIVDKEIESTIREDEKVNQLYKLITSINGVGAQTAYYMIILTNGFLSFKQWRKFASYAGIAPFPHRSGSSIKGQTKVNQMANKKIKSLLHTCAMNAILHNPEMRLYYQRRLEAGKSKMSTLNIVRNKLLARIFAVVQRGSDYVDTYKFASA